MAVTRVDRRKLTSQPVFFEGYVTIHVTRFIWQTGCQVNADSLSDRAKPGVSTRGLADAGDHGHGVLLALAATGHIGRRCGV
jgi:hypothetical protein